MPMKIEMTPHFIEKLIRSEHYEKDDFHLLIVRHITKGLLMMMKSQPLPWSLANQIMRLDEK